MAKETIEKINHTNECQLCGSKRIGYRFMRGDSKVVQCDNCTFLFLDSQIINESKNKDHNDISCIHLENKKSENKGMNIADKYINCLSDYCQGGAGKLLIIGNSDNKFASLAKRRGFDVTCVKSFGELKFKENTFDVCVLFDVLEHAYNPLNLLKKIHGFLKEDGVLFLLVPTLDNLSAKLMENNLMNFKEEHLYYFNEQTIQNALTKTGYDRIMINQLKNFGIFNRVINVVCRKKELRVKPLLSIVLPVYNEKSTFNELIDKLIEKQLEGIDKEIVIIESNSTDGTREEVLKYKSRKGIKVILENRPKGKGHAVRTGFKHIEGDFVIIQDGDLEYDLNDYDQLLKPLLNYSKAFVLGSRHGKGWKMRHFAEQPMVSFVMNFGHWFFAGLLNLFCGSNLKDPFTMYKVFRKDCLHGLSFSANRFDFDWELVMKLLRKGYKPLEIPVNYNSRSFHEGKKVSFILDPLLWFVALFRFRFEPLYVKDKK